MNLRRLCIFLFIALFAVATGANAAVHRVHPGDSIQDAIDSANPGDTILVWPGDYQEDPTSRYGLHVTTDNIRLVGRAKHGKKVRILHNGDQETGVYAAPPGCEYTESACAAPNLQGFYIRGFTVEGFPKNGIQTRWVDDFSFVKNESVDNLNNGIYPTLSANGLVLKNTSYGSLDTAMWVAGSQNVRVIGNELRDSVIGFEITVSNDVWVTANKVHGNVNGMGLFHPNAAGNPPLPVMENWVIVGNKVYDNNLIPNPAPPGSFQAGVPPGTGILMLGISDHVVAFNQVTDNDFVGIGVLGWCTATLFGDPARNCIADPPIWPTDASNNVIVKNYAKGNAENVPPLGPLEDLAADISFVDLIDGSSGNCFKWNHYDTHVATTVDGELPTDGC